jgi:hypothetical protein
MYVITYTNTQVNTRTVCMYIQTEQQRTPFWQPLIPVAIINIPVGVRTLRNNVSSCKRLALLHVHCASQHQQSAQLHALVHYALVHVINDDKQQRINVRTCVRFIGIRLKFLLVPCHAGQQLFALLPHLQGTDIAFGHLLLHRHVRCYTVM